MSRNEISDLQLGLADICTVLCDISDPDQMQEFLTEMLTPAERRDLALRWELMRRLKKSIPQLVQNNPWRKNPETGSFRQQTLFERRRKR